MRSDSSIDVPEPELAVVLNAAGEVAGYTICNDMSSRSIEGENPLYLPQAKIYLGGCAVGPWIVPAWEVPDPYALTIELAIARDGSTAWAGSASTAALHRKIDELAAYLFRADEFPAGVILSTGTSLVPELPFTLEAGDEVRIRISGIGELANPVVRGKPASPASAASLLRSRRSMRGSWKPTVRAAASTVAPWPIRCSARSTPQQLLVAQRGEAGRLGEPAGQRALADAAGAGDLRERQRVGEPRLDVILGTVRGVAEVVAVPQHGAGLLLVPFRRA